MMYENISLAQVFTIVVLLSITSLMYFYSRNTYPIISYSNLQITNNDSIDDQQTSSAKLQFLINKGHWNLTLNSFIQIKLEADISANINSIIHNNMKSLEKVYQPKISVSEQAKHYGSMSAVGVNMNSSTNKTLTLIFSRIWYSKTICHGACNPDRSYIYVEAFTSNYCRIAYNFTSKNGGKIIRIPSFLNITVPELNECCLGPEDPRIVLDENNELFFTFNMLDQDKRRKIWLYNIFTHRQTSISIEKNSLSTVQKNWSPFIRENKLHFIYSYHPLKILQCPSENGSCQFLSSAQGQDQIGSLRGGTQLIRYQNSDYYVGIARTTISCEQCQRFYRPHLVVLATNFGNFQLVYVSEPLMMDEIPMFASYFISQKSKRTNDFCENIIRIMTPGSIIGWKWPEDKLTFTISINDMKSYVVSITGFGSVVQKMMSAIETEYSSVFFDEKLNRKLVFHSETIALNYCRSASKINKFLVQKLTASDRYPKKKIIKNVLDSPTYPTFQVASNTKSESLNLWIKSDFVHFGLMGRYLIDYESAHGHQPPGTHLMVDAGGNHATYALYSAALNQSVLVFEILPVYWVVIQESIRINPKFDERMILYPFGVSDEYREWKIIPREGLTRLDFTKAKSSNDLTVAQTYPLDDFVFRKVSVLKIDVEGFEIRALKGATRMIRHWGVGAILIEIASKRWSWNNITLAEGIFVLEQVTSMGNYLSYVIARNDGACPIAQIAKLHGMIETKNLSMINMQDGTYGVTPQIFRFTEWTTIMVYMKENDWICNFWLESSLKRV